MDLQTAINNLSSPQFGNKLSVIEYHNLLRRCVSANEFAATIFVYEHLLESGHKANDITFKIIDPLHSKTVEEKNFIHLKTDGKKRLAPRRRIHKIMKGHNYHDAYASAKVYLPKVRAFLTINPNLKTEPRIKLAKAISKGCNISFNEARYVITGLKRDKFLLNIHEKSFNSVPVGTVKPLEYYFN